MCHHDALLHLDPLQPPPEDAVRKGIRVTVPHAALSLIAPPSPITAHLLLFSPAWLFQIALGAHKTQLLDDVSPAEELVDKKLREEGWEERIIIEQSAEGEFAKQSLAQPDIPSPKLVIHY